MPKKLSIPRSGSKKPVQFIQPLVPKAGWHNATMIAITETDTGADVIWKIHAEARDWEIEQSLTDEMLIAFAVAVGDFGGEIDIDDLVGESTQSQLITRGGRRSGEIVAFRNQQ